MGLQAGSGAGVRVEAGVTLFREGDACDCAYYLERGEVEVSILRDGQSVVLCRKGAGELFGEMAIVDGGRRSATVTTITPCDLVPFTREQLLARLERADPVLQLCLSLLMNRLRWTIGHVRAENRPPSACPPARCDRAAQAIRLEHELELALADRQLELHYQPIVTLPDGSVAGFEALVRWRHPDKGLLPPSEFLSAAEASGLIRKIDAWAIAQACAELRRFEAATRRTTGRTARAPSVAFVAVNVSAPGLTDPGFLDHVHRTIRAAGVPPGTLRLELTETVLMAADPGRVLAGCRELGIGLALDDFGTGYSSLSYLDRFPIDTVKLDRSFVQDARPEAGARPMLRGILRLIQDLGMPVVAEGIERAAQVSLLAELGASFGQGFHFARPMPADAARAFLAAAPPEARPVRRSVGSRRRMLGGPAIPHMTPGVPVV